MNLKSAAAIATLTTLAAFAGAEPVTMNFTGTGAGQGVSVSHYGDSFGVFVGQLRHDVSRADDHDELLGEQFTYCVDLHEYVSSSDQDFWLTNLNYGDIPTAGDLYATERTQAIGNVLAVFGSDAYAEGISDDFAAAFQLTLWEIITDYDPTAGLSSIDFTSGNFQASGFAGAPLTNGIMDKIYCFLPAIETYAQANAWIVSRDGGQDQLLFVPTPGSLALAGLGLTLTTRRRRS